MLIIVCKALNVYLNIFKIILSAGLMLSSIYITLVLGTPCYAAMVHTHKLFKGVILKGPKCIFKYI